jgi:ribosomal protein L11 methyltransferase
MSWLSVSLQTDAEFADQLCDALMDAGALSASIEDADAGTPEEEPQFGEPGSITTPGWRHSRVVALLESDADPADLLSQACVAAGLKVNIPFSVEIIEEQNWVQLTQSQFDPIRVSGRLWIVPSWHVAPDVNAINLVLDPGMAFGTGSHPTTRLCLEWLERTVQAGETLLDYGCGSGILAIAAAKLGAGLVKGVDIDPQAVVAAKANAERNTVEAAFHDNSKAVEGEYDRVVANILSNPLKILAPAICTLVKPGGALALSGILEAQTQEIVDIYQPWIDLSAVDIREGWVCLAGHRRPV